MNHFDIDLMNALRLFLNGVDMAQPQTEEMTDDFYNGLAFAQANDVSQFVYTTESDFVIAEICEMYTIGLANIQFTPFF